MAQLSLYLEDAAIKKLGAAAQETGCSVSKYVSRILDLHFVKRDNAETAAKAKLNALLAMEPDETLMAPLEIPWDYQLPREKLT
jgi:hypothetical protein